MHQLDDHLKTLVAKGQEQGFLTFTQVNDYLPDEAINLAAAFQLAGYRRVVATMWPVEDKMADRVARACYEELWSAGTAAVVARSLHNAIRKIRTTHADQPSRWAAHMHSGS